VGKGDASANALLTTSPNWSPVQTTVHYFLRYVTLICMIQ